MVSCVMNGLVLYQFQLEFIKYYACAAVRVFSILCMHCCTNKGERRPPIFFGHSHAFPENTEVKEPKTASAAASLREAQDVHILHTYIYILSTAV